MIWRYKRHVLLNLEACLLPFYRSVFAAVMRFHANISFGVLFLEVVLAGNRFIHSFACINVNAVTARCIKLLS